MHYCVMDSPHLRQWTKSKFIIDINHSFTWCLTLFTYNTCCFSSYLSFINQTAKGIWESLSFQTTLKVLEPPDPPGVCSSTVDFIDFMTCQLIGSNWPEQHLPSTLKKTSERALSHSSFKRNESQQRLRFFGGSVSSWVSINPAIAAVRLWRLKHQWK